MKKLFLTIIATLSFVCGFADDVVWVGNTSSSWLTASNWQSGIIPGNADVAVFKYPDSMRMPPTLTLLEMTQLFIEVYLNTATSAFPGMLAWVAFALNLGILEQ